MQLRWRTLEIPYRHGHFTISGGQSTAARTVLLRADQEDAMGFGEAVPSGRVLGMTEELIENRFAEAAGTLRPVRVRAEGDPPRNPFEGRGGAFACAVDGALLDLWASLRDEPVWQALGLPRAKQHTTATVSLDTPAAMAAEARGHWRAGFTHLKIKLGEAPARDLPRLHAVRDEVPRAVLRVDGNEGWTLDDVVTLLPGFAESGVEFIEQPLRRDADDATLRRLTALCADHEVWHVLDETVHGPADAERIGAAGLAHGVNLKLQKAGGLRRGIEVVEIARRHDLKVMLGCFIETWAGIALALQLAGAVDWVDLDGAWLLAEEPVSSVGMAFLDRGILRASDAAGLGIRESRPLFR